MEMKLTFSCLSSKKGSQFNSVFQSNLQTIIHYFYTDTILKPTHIMKHSNLSFLMYKNVFVKINRHTYTTCKKPRV